MEKYLAIGDIHGCVVQLTELLEKALDFPNHRLVFLGDYIDRGPDSEKVIGKLLELDAIFLRGNHEEMLISRIDNEPERESEFLTISGLSKNSVQWIRKSLISKYETEKYIFVHAGMNVKKLISQQTENDYLWSNFDGSYESLTEKTVIHGHVVRKEVEFVGNRININTGCGLGGKLTGLLLPEMKFIFSSFSEKKKYDWEELLTESYGELEEDAES